MNTEFKDFEWVQEVVAENPWHKYNYIFINRVPKKENVELLIKLAFDSGFTDDNDRLRWMENHDDNVNTIIKYSRNNGQSYLRISFSRLYYGCDYAEKENHKWVDYSDLFED